MVRETLGPGQHEFTFPTVYSQLNITKARATVAYSVVNSTILSPQENWKSDVGLNVTLYFESLRSLFKRQTLLSLIQVLDSHDPTSITPDPVMSLGNDILLVNGGAVDAEHQLRNLTAYAIHVSNHYQDDIQNSGSHALTVFIHTIYINCASLLLFTAIGTFIIGLCLGHLIRSCNRLSPTVIPALSLTLIREVNVPMEFGKLWKVRMERQKTFCVQIQEHGIILVKVSEK